MATLPYWNNDEVISSDKLNSMVNAIITGNPVKVKVSNATKNDVDQIVGYLSNLYTISKTNLNSATSTSDLDTAYTDMMSLVSNKIGFCADDDTVDLYATGIRASMIQFLQAYTTMMSNDRLNNKNVDNTLSGRIDSERNARIHDTNNTIKNLSSKINQTANDINSTVNSTKQNLQGQIDSANTKITQTADGITSTVSRVEGKLNNLKISSRNYIQNSESIIMQPNGTDNYDLVWHVYNDAFASNAYCHDTNKTRFSFYLTPSKELSTARTFRIYWRADPYASFGAITVPANTTATQYYELTTTTPTSQPIASQIFIRFMKQDTSDVSYTITKSMLTIGDSFPDWQPAPEDTDSAIKAVSSKVDQTADSITSTVNRTKQDLQGKIDSANTKITQTADSITSAVNSTKQDLQGKIDSANAKINKTADDINGKVSDVNGKVDSTKQDLQGQIDTANTKITQTANSITEQLKSYSKTDDMQKYVDTTVQKTADGITSTVNSTKQDLQGKISKTADDLNGKVSAVDDKIDSTKQDLQGKIDNTNAKITQTADSITSSVNSTKQDLQGKIDSANARITQTATSITSNVNSVKQDLQGKIDTANAKITQTADGITSTVNSTKQDLQGKIDNANAKITQTADSLNNKVSGVENKIDNLQIGGINLLKDTDKMTNTNYWQLRGAQSVRAEYGGKHANEVGVALSDYNVQGNSSNPYIDYIPQVSFEQGTDYTVSFWTTVVDAPMLYLNANDNADHHHNSSQQNIPLQASGRVYGDWKQVTATFKPTVATAYLTFAVSTAWVSSFKLEKGNKATDWQPSPEDTNSAIENVSSKIDQTADSITSTVNGVKQDLQGKIDSTNAKITQTANGITSTVNSTKQDLQGKIDNTNTKIDQTTTNITSAFNTTKQDLQGKIDSTKQDLQGKITQTADSINNRVSGVDDKVNNTNHKINDITSNGGGKNLLLGTSDAWTTKTGSGWLNATTAKDTKTSVAYYPSGNKFTYSATVINKSNSDVRLEMWCCDIDGNRINGSQITSDSVAPNTTAKRISCTITIDSNTWYVEHTIISNGDSTSKTVQIKDEMFEAGVIAHDWTPAPEDTNTAIENVSSKIDQTANSITSTVNSVKQNLQGQIDNTNTKITQTANSISSSIDSTKQDLQGKIDSANTKITQTSDSITEQLKNYSKTSDMQNYVDTTVQKTADGITSRVSGVESRVDEANDKIDKTATNLSSTVNSTKQDLQGKINSVNTKIDQTAESLTSTVNSTKQNLQGQIAQTANDINGKVSGVENKVDIANSKINNLSISDRNLARGTSDNWTNYVFVTDGGTNVTMGLSRVYIDGLEVGDVITCGITIKNTGITAGTMYVQGSGNATGWGDGSYSSPNYDIASAIPSGTTKELVYTITLTANMIKNSFWDTSIRTDNVPKGGTLSYKCFFVKKGNIPTSWTPAPEDVQSQIDANKTATANAQSTANSAHNTALNANTTANSALTKANSAVTTANSANATATQANSTASSVVSVANQANTNATSANATAKSANTNATSAVSVANSALTKANSAVSVANNANTNASSAVSTASQANETANSANSNANQAVTTANSANNKVDAIQANGGGRNLLVGSDPTLINSPSLGGVIEVNVDGVKAWKSTSNSSNIMYNNISLEANTTYTYSALISADADGGLGFLCYGNFQVKNPKAHNQSDPTHEDIPSKRDYHGITVRANQWTRIYYTFTTNDLSGSTFGVYPSYIDGHDRHTVYIRHLMLEKGTISHDWQSAPEDVDAKITTNSTAIEQNKKAIALKADQETVNQTNGAVQRLQSQLNVQAGQIDSKVSSSDFTALSGRTMQNRGTVSSPDFNSLTQAGYYTITNPAGGQNYPTGSGGTLEVSGQVADFNGRLNQKYVSDNGGRAYTRQYNNSTKMWTTWVKVANQYDVNSLSDQIATKVSNTYLNSKGYATQTYTQTQIKQTADSITSTVNSTKQNLQGQIDSANAKITQTADDISNVDTKVEQYKTGIDQTATGINLFAQVITGNSSIDVTKSNIGIDPNQIKIASNKIVIDGDTEFRGNGKWLDGKYINIEKLNHTENNTDYIDQVSFDSGGIRFSEYEWTHGEPRDGSVLRFDNDKLGAVINVDYYQNKKAPGLSIVGNDVGISAEPMGTSISASDPVSHLLLQQGSFGLDAAQASGRGTVVGISGDVTTGNLTLEGNIQLSGSNVTVQHGTAITVQATPTTQDKLMVVAQMNPNSTQYNTAQPTLRAGQSLDNLGDSGLTFYWNSVKAFGTFDLRDTHVLGNRNTHFSVETTFDTDGEANMCFTWTSRSDLWNNDKLPMLARADWWTSQWGSGGIGIANGHLFFFTNDGRTYRLIG